MKTIKFCLIVILFIRGAHSYGQTTNTGVFTIAAGTEVSVQDQFNNTNTGSFMNDGDLYIHQNFNNDGAFSFFQNAVNGTTHFVGNAIQEITGNLESRFYNITFNNPTAFAAFQLKSNIHAYNTVNFSRGVVQNDIYNGEFVFENDANHINASNDSYVNGAVQKNGSTTFEFPIGAREKFRKASITAPISFDDEIVATYFLENSNTKYTHNLSAGIIDQIDTNEYWLVEQKNGTSNVVLTLTWDETTTSSAILNAPKTALHILRWDATEGFWVDEGGIVDEATNSVTTVAEISGYGVFTLGTIKEDLILPGGLVVYNAVTPDDDGKNDFFFIDGVKDIPNNTMEIFNRWGVKVYETKGYNESDNVFKGISEGRLTVNKNKKLPAGTYFYVLNYEYNSENIKKAGYLYLNSN